MSDEFNHIKPLSTDQIMNIIDDIKDFSKREDLSAYEKLMILVPLCEDHKMVPSNVNNMISDFIVAVIDNIKNKEEQRIEKERLKGIQIAAAKGNEDVGSGN